MNVLGMGTIEILVILLVAFIILGPKRMADAARLLGKATREVRRMTEGLPELVLDEEQQGPAEEPIVHRAGGHSRSGSEAIARSPEPSEAHRPVSQDEGPVAFRPSGTGGETASQDGTESRGRADLARAKDPSEGGDDTPVRDRNGHGASADGERKQK